VETFLETQGGTLLTPSRKGRQDTLLVVAGAPFV
jgi:hypothetical protein